MARFRKDDIEFHSDRSDSHAAVNVKVHVSYRDVPLPLELGRVSTDGGRTFRDVRTDDGFTHDWIEANVNESALSDYFDMACRDAWEMLSEEAERIYGIGHGVFSEGRSGGWAVVQFGRRAIFDRDDVASWDAIAVARWARFSTFARELANDVPRIMVDSIYANVYEPDRDADADVDASMMAEVGKAQ